MAVIDPVQRAQVGMLTQGSEFADDFLEAALTTSPAQRAANVADPRSETLSQQIRRLSQKFSGGARAGIGGAVGGLLGNSDIGKTNPQILASRIAQAGGLRDDEGFVREELLPDIAQLGTQEGLTEIRKQLALDKKLKIQQADRQAVADYLKKNFPNRKDLIPLALQGLLTFQDLGKVVPLERTVERAAFADYLAPFYEGPEFEGLREAIMKGLIRPDNYKEVIPDMYKTIDIVDQVTGITNTFIQKPDGSTGRKVGISSLPELDIQKFEQKDGSDGFRVTNPVTGAFNVYDTQGSAEMQKDKRNKLLQQIEKINGSLGILGQTRDLVKENSGGLTSTGSGIGYSIFSRIPRIEGFSPTEVANVIKSNIASIKAALGFEQIQALRANSESGSSGLGNVTNIELLALQEVVSQLDPSVGAEQFEIQAARVEHHLNNAIKALLGEEPTVQWFDTVAEQKFKDGKTITVTRKKIKPIWEKLSKRTNSPIKVGQASKDMDLFKKSEYFVQETDPITGERMYSVINPETNELTVRGTFKP